MKIEMPCFDCNKETKNTDYYMLTDELWQKIMPQEDGCGGYFLCFNCLEKRLNRKLKKEDFADLEMNRRAKKERLHKL